MTATGSRRSFIDLRESDFIGGTLFFQSYPGTTPPPGGK
jgi:hypothetical protein